MANLFASGTYPFVQWQPSEVDSVQHTDQEVVQNNASYMFRQYNAEYNPTAGHWNTLTAGVSDAYATVQNPDGSIHYYWNGGAVAWSSWLGSGNNAVYNAVDYGLVAGAGVGSAIQVANVAALQNAINDIILDRGALGGTLVIPAGTYLLSGTVTIANMNSSGTGGILIRGESNATTLVQQGSSEGEATDTFDVRNDSNPASWGVRFRDLTIQYKKDLSTAAGAVAINCISGISDITAEDCAFVNCPQAFAAGSAGAATHCGLVNCTVFQDAYNDSTQILLGGYECFVFCCEIYQYPMVKGGPTGCTGIEVLSASEASAEGCRVYGCHISDFYTGIAVQESVFTAITACEIDAAVALNIVPSSSTANIYGVFGTSCKFGMLLAYTPPTPTSGVFIDTNGGANSNVEGIFLNNCLAYGYANAGVQINAGQSVHINGGKYSSNGTTPGTVFGAGVAITGTCNQARVTGADCSGIFDFLPSPPTQPYGVTVVIGATDVLVANCDLTSNGVSAMYAPTSGTDVRVVDCLGYNDQGTLVSSAAPISGTDFNGSYFGYYGPVTFYTNSVPNAVISGIAIQGNSTGLLSGAFRIGAGPTPSAAVTYSSTGGAKPDFLVIGR